jgi:hypothetical protein
MTAQRMRAGTSDRQAAVDGLTRQLSEGRLTVGEFDERVGTAYAATYLDELAGLFADLPAAHPRREAGSGVHRSGRNDVVPFRPSAPPDPRSGPHRPMRILAVLAVLALVFLIGLLTHGLFLFPLGWVAFFVIFNGGGGHRVDPPTRNNNRY